MNQLAVIVVIAHKITLSDNEKASLRQCYNVLGRHQIKLICPAGLDVSVYKAINPEAEIVFIDPKWQSSYLMFNELKKDILLYEMFSNYKYILYYELDAWVFTDQLEYWCKKSYDYIGSPWFKEYGVHSDNLEFMGVGNGGFSLRNIESSLRLSRRISRLISMRSKWYKYKIQSVIRFEKILWIFRKRFNIQNIFFLRKILLSKSYKVYEDSFWGRYVGETFSDFVVAKPNEALKFGFEVHPRYLFELNNRILPMGCHAWERYDPRFWQEFIPENIHEEGKHDNHKA